MTTAAQLAVVVASLVLGAIAVLQVAAATGCPVGRFVWGGQHDVLPPRLRVGSALSVPLYAAMLLVLLARGEAFGPPGDTASVATWVLTGYFALGVVLNAVSRSRAERMTMTPACTVLLGCCLVVASG